MGKKEDLEKLDRNIKDSESRLRNFQVNIDVVQKEITFLSNIENQLNENISYLKKNKIVTLATEYKKSKEELKKTKNRLAQLKGDKTINEKAYKELATSITKDKESYDKLSKQNENNILQGKFGRKRG